MENKEYSTDEVLKLLLDSPKAHEYAAAEIIQDLISRLNDSNKRNKDIYELCDDIANKSKNEIILLRNRIEVLQNLISSLKKNQTIT